MMSRLRGFKKKLMSLSVFVLAGASLLPALALAQQQIATTQLAPQLYLLHGYTPNVIASVGPDGILLCDASYEELGDKVSAALGTLGKEKIRYIINTHWHFDHTGGNKVFGRDTVIIAHENVRPYLITDQLLLGQVQKAYPEHAVPNLTLTGPTTIYFNGETIKIIPLPGGHTNGDLIVYFEKANVLHIGDIVFTDMLPFIDLERGGNVLRLIENIGKVIAMMPPDVRIIPGHVRECHIEDLRNYQAMLEATVGVVQAEMEKGKSLEEIKAAGVLKDWEKWATGPARCDDWIEAIYKSVLAAGKDTVICKAVETIMRKYGWPGDRIPGPASSLGSSCRANPPAPWPQRSAPFPHRVRFRAYSRPCWDTFHIFSNEASYGLPSSEQHRHSASARARCRGD